MRLGIGERLLRILGLRIMILVVWLVLRLGRLSSERVMDLSSLDA
jgi:hypothetical protein